MFDAATIRQIGDHGVYARAVRSDPHQRTRFLAQIRRQASNFTRRAFAVIRGHAAKDERRWGSSLTIIRALNEMDAVAVSQLPADPCERARGGLLNTG